MGKEFFFCLKLFSLSSTFTSMTKSIINKEERGAKFTSVWGLCEYNKCYGSKNLYVEVKKRSLINIFQFSLSVNQENSGRSEKEKSFKPDPKFFWKKNSKWLWLDIV